MAATPRAAKNIDHLIRPRRSEIGSVEGHVNMISLAGSTPRFVLYETITKKAASCRFEVEKLDEIKMALGKRAVVTGVVSYNRKNQPHSINLESFRVLRDRTGLPSVDSMRSVYGDLTSELTTKEYLDLVRGC